MPEWLTESVILQTIISTAAVLVVIGPVYLKTRSETKKARAEQAEARKQQDSVNGDIAEVLATVASDAKEARIQVKNSHDTNLREEGDERHEATMAALKELGRDVRGLRESSYATRQDIGLLHAEDRVTRRETQELRREFSEHIEQTAPMMPALEKLIQQVHPPE